MPWSPELLVVPDLSVRQFVLVWAVGFPLTCLLFLILTVTGIYSVHMTESMLQQQVELAGPVKRFFLVFFVGPVLVIIGQFIFCLALLSLFSGVSSKR